jgi:hypothetical protein
MAAKAYRSKEQMQHSEGEKGDFSAPPLMTNSSERSATLWIQTDTLPNACIPCRKLRHPL